MLMLLCKKKNFKVRMYHISLFDVEEVVKLFGRDQY